MNMLLRVYHAQFSSDYSRRNGCRRFQLAAGAGRVQTRPTRRGFRTGLGFDSRPALARRRSRRPHAPRSRSFSNSRSRRAYLADVLHARGEDGKSALQVRALAFQGRSPRTPGTLRCRNFVEVFLAREGHNNPVGINYLEKVQLPHLASVYGAMLAGVGYILMGAGVPLKIPGVLDRFANHEP